MLTRRGSFHIKNQKGLKVMTQKKKLSSRFLSLFLAVLMIASMIPTTVFAAPASDIPSEMLDNVYLDALAYTGYGVQAQKNEGTIFKTYGSRATAYGSDISYGLVKYGTETVTKSGTATGLAPDIAGFESSGLCCASYVSYVYYNYLPNIAGIDTSGVAKPGNPRSASSYNTAANAWVKAGTARRIGFTQNADGNNFVPSEEIPIGSLDKNGYFLTDYYVCGDGWNIREITPSEGYLLDENIYWLDVDAGQYTVEKNTEDLDVYEDVILGGFYLFKHRDNGDTQIETEEIGAEFEVYLKSAGSYENAKETERAYLITDEWGYAETDWLPYGVYTVKQVKGTEGYDLMKPFDVYIHTDWEYQQFIINNAPFTSYVKIQKTDAESGLAIPYAGAAFQIYNPDGTKVSMEYTYPEHTIIDTFYTNEDGYLITPESLGYGKGYYLVEVSAPYGYVLNSDPVYFDITADDATDEGGLTIVNVTRSNMPQKGVIHITKTGEVFQSVVVNDQMHKPVYEIKNLAGAVFEIRAAEDIYTLDGVMHYAKGELVDTITTGSDGIATSKELYLGKYTIQEITAPHSMVLNGKVQTVELVYAGQEISITKTSGNLYNERQKVKVSLSKVLEQNELFGIGMNAELKNITFGLYAQTDIVAADGTKIPVDGLIEIITFDENGKAVISTDLPLGSYYVQERSTDDHYILSDEKFGFEFTYGEQTIEVIELAVNNGAAIENELKYGSVSGLKVDEDGKVIKGAVFGLFSNDENEYTRENAYMVTESAEDGTFKFEKIPYGTWVVREIEPAVGFVLNEKAYQITIQEDGDVVEIKLENRYICGDIEGLKLDEDGNVIAGAKFGLFKPGTTEFTEETAVLVTESDSEGKFRFEDIRFGKWIARELAYATGYVLNETPIEVNI